MRAARRRETDRRSRTHLGEPVERLAYAGNMSATGDENQLESDASVREAFRQIGDIYVETARELFKDDPDLCLDPPELSELDVTL